jgi:hypothetical protein
MTGIQEADAALWSDSERVTSERGDENVTHDEQGRRLHEDEGSAAVAADWTGIGRKTTVREAGERLGLSSRL